MKYLVSILVGFILGQPAAWGQVVPYPGYADAVRRADVASTESGVLVEILVREGDQVEAGQPLVRLDFDAHESNLAAAQHEAQNTGEIRVAQARVRLLELAVAKLRELVTLGNARPLELEREETELEIARATLELRRHDYIARQHQVERSRIQLEKRTILAPFAGQVAKIHRQVGEFVSLHSAEVVTLVDPTELQAEFAIPLAESRYYQPGQIVQLRTEDAAWSAEVHQLGVLVDRSSQTVTLQVRFVNQPLTIKPGTDCVLLGPIRRLPGQGVSAKIVP